MDSLILHNRATKLLGHLSGISVLLPWKYIFARGYTNSNPTRLGEEVQLTHNFFSNGIISSLQVIQHFGHNLLGIASVTHGIEKVYCSLSYAHISFSLREKPKPGWLTIAGVLKRTHDRHKNAN